MIAFASLFFALAFAAGRKPQCRYLCDDPVCDADCKPVCEKPTCDIQCPTSNVRCDLPSCTTRCAPNQNASDTCPNCETVCNPPACSPSSSPCDILCLAPVCYWHCALPTNCPKVRCELTCERPACEAPVDSLATTISASFTVVAAVIFATIIFV